MDLRVAWVLIGLVCGVADLRAQPGPDQAALDEAVRLGTVAALAPLCGVRDEGWAFDLRRAEIMRGTGAGGTDDPALRGAPGSDQVVGAMSFAEAEALESFAEEVPAEACGTLRRDPALGEADAVVERFRALKSAVKPGS